MLYTECFSCQVFVKKITSKCFQYFQGLPTCFTELLLKFYYSLFSALVVIWKVLKLYPNQQNLETGQRYSGQFVFFRINKLTGLLIGLDREIAPHWSGLKSEGQDPNWVRLHFCS